MPGQAGARQYNIHLLKLNHWLCFCIASPSSLCYLYQVVIQNWPSKSSALRVTNSMNSSSWSPSEQMRLYRITICATSFNMLLFNLTNSNYSTNKSKTIYNSRFYYMFALYYIYFISLWFCLFTFTFDLHAFTELHKYELAYMVGIVVNWLLVYCLCSDTAMMILYLSMHLLFL